MVGFVIKFGRTQKEIDDIEAAYTAAHASFTGYIQRLQQQQQAAAADDVSTSLGLVPVGQQQSEGVPLLDVQQAATLIVGRLSLNDLINMRKQVEDFMTVNPKSPRLQEVMTRALRATEAFAQNPFNPAVRNEFFRARLAVRRLGDAAVGVSAAMGGVGLAMAIVGAALLFSGVGSAAGIILFAVGLGLGKGAMIPVLFGMANKQEIQERRQIGVGMYDMKVAADSPRPR